MKNNYTLFILFLLISSFQAFSQEAIECMENKELAKTIQEEIPPNQVLFIFNTKEQLTIKHEAIDTSEQKVTPLVNGLQKLYIPFEYPNGTIKLSMGDLNYTLNYGNIAGAKNLFNGVKGGEIRCFDVMKKKKLELAEKTINFDKGFQTEDEKDALIEINVDPKNLEFSIKKEDYITKISKDSGKGTYKILVNPNSNGEERKITIVKEGYTTLSIPLGNVQPKDFRVFAIKDNNIELGKYIIRSIPNGAKISIKGQPYYNMTNPVTPNEYNGKPGKYYIVLKKPRYKVYKGSINISENTKPIKLIPKVGLLNIPASDDNVGADVYVDKKIIGKIPITNYKLLVGKHEIRFYKEHFLPNKENYFVNIIENKSVTFDNFEISRVKKIRIVTEPKTGAKVYIDGNPGYRKSNFTIKLSEGIHQIKIVKKHYKTYESSFVVDEHKDTHVFTLEKATYEATFDSSPSSDVYVDGDYKGRSPLTINLPDGYHKVTYKRSGVLTESHTYNINEYGEKHHSNLYPSSFSFMGGNYGVGQIGLDMGLTYNRLFFGIGFYSQLKKDQIDVSELTLDRIEVDDIDSYGKEYGRVYPEGKSNKNTSMGLKIGYLFRWPFPFVLSVGGASITTDMYYKVHKAHSDYESYGQVVLLKGELFSERELKKNEVLAFTGGIMIPLFKTVYISGEYYSNSDVGPGFSFGIGFLLNLNYNSY